jgi:hypothetical protein
MFCPTCGTEYRSGFARCSDCKVELGPSLPAGWEELPHSSQNNRREQAKPVQFLAWFLPMGSFYIVTLLLMFVPSMAHHSFLVVFLVLFFTVSNFGALWMLYQSIRYEGQVGRYVLLSFVPFMFVWYRLVRYQLRRKSCAVNRKVPRVICSFLRSYLTAGRI